MTGRKLLVLTDCRSDGQAFSAYHRQIFDRVLEHAERVCGKWDEVDLVGCDQPRAEMKKRRGWDTLLVGYNHAEEIKRLSDMNLEKLKPQQLCGLLADDGRQRVVATYPLNIYGSASGMPKVSPTRSALLGQLYRHLELLSAGHLGWKDPAAPAKYRLVRNSADWRELHTLLDDARVVAIDTETVDLRRIGNSVLTLQFGVDGKTGWVLPIAHPESPLETKQLMPILSWLRDYMERARPAVHVYANAVFDLHQMIDLLKLRWYNHRVWDVQIGAFNLDENRQGLKGAGSGKGDIWGLERLCLESGMDHYSRTKIGKSDRSRLVSKSLEDVAEYGGVDVVAPLRLMQMQRALAAWRNKRIPGQPYSGFVRHVVDVEGVKLQQFAWMERHGLKADVDYMLSLSGTSGVFLKDIAESESQIRAIPAAIEANARLMNFKNVRSGSLFGGKSAQAFVLDVNKHLHREILFGDVLGLQPLSRGKPTDRNPDGAPKYDKHFKEKYRDVPAVAAFEDLVEAKTLYSTYIKGWYDLLRGSLDNRDGRLHTIFSTLNVVTGRSSSTEPNLQNIPQRKAKRAKIVKRQIICEDANLIVKRDFSAHEIRLWGISARDKVIALAFWTGMKVRLAYQATRKIAAEEVAAWEVKIKAADVHRQNFAMLYGVKAETVSDEQRSGVKTTIFGSLYGYGMATLGKVLTKAIPKRIKAIDVELAQIEKDIRDAESSRRRVV